MSGIVSSSWGVLVAQHQRLKLVEDALNSRSIEHFIPVEEKLSIERGRHVRKFIPVLGDYVPFAVTAAWKSLRRVKGIAGLLLNESGYPAQVLPHEMERLRAFCDGMVWKKSDTASGPYEFQYGQRVTLKTGPLAYHSGRYDKKMKRGDAAFFLLFGREQRIIFEPGELLAA